MTGDRPFGDGFKRNLAGRKRRRATFGITAAVLVVALLVWLIIRLPSGSECGHGVVRKGGECVGVTDGSVDFDPAMKAIDRRILKENQQIKKDKSPYVTVAFLGALSTTTEHNFTGGRAVHEVEGAYIAQMRANNGAAGGNSPKIRLVLANEGSDQAQWPYVVGRLEKMVTTDHLVAVVGLGLSNKQTVDSTRRLSAKGIAMVGDVVTGDGIDSAGRALPAVGDGPASRINGLARVAWHVSQEVSVLAQYLRGRIKTAAMIVDQEATDLYSRSLDTGFKAAFSDAIKKGGRLPEPIIVTSPGQPGIDNLYATVAANLNLCGGDPPDVLLYAGRTIFLPGLLRYLEHCQKRPITIVTGSDAEGVAGFSAVTPAFVTYVPLADPDQLDSPRNPNQAAYQRFLADCVRYYPAFKPADLRDAWGIMAHDAFLTAAQAVRLAAGPHGETRPSPKAVANLLYSLHSANKIEGAAGPIEIDGNGNPVPRPLPVIRLSADGTREFLGSYRPAPEK